MANVIAIVGHLPGAARGSGWHPPSQEMIELRLEDGLRVANLMTKEPFTLQLDASVRSAAALMADRGVGCVVILDGTRLVGIVTDRDIAVRCVATGLDSLTPLRQIMTSNPIAVSPGTSADDALQIMVDRDLGRLCVADRSELVGIVTFGDLAVLAGLVVRGLGRGAAATPPWSPSDE